jgi:Ca-activated chloride channel family protein
MTRSNAERLLTEQPTAPAPEGLAEKIKNEIPDKIEIHPSFHQPERVVRWHRRRNVHLAVAAVFVVALTAAVTWRMRAPTPLQSSSDRQIVVEPIVERIPPVDDDRRSRAEAEETVVREVVGGAGGAQSAAEVDVDRDVRAIDRTHASESIPRQPSGLETEQAAGPEPPPVARPAPELPPEARLNGASEDNNQPAEVTDEMIEQAIERSFEGEVTVTGSLVPRADLTALSPITVTETPSRSQRPSSSWRQKYGSNKGDSATAVTQAVGEESSLPLPSTGGTDEPNDQPYGDVFFREYGVNPFIDTDDDRYSTFALEVDTGSYNVIRRYLTDGNLPPREAVRIEEIVNAFDYGDAPPDEGDFALSAEGAPSPFADGQRYQIIRFGVRGRVVDEAERPAAVLTFVVDVSGSMARENRLGLVKKALAELLDHLREDDRVGLVVYGSTGKVLLEPTANHDAIRDAIRQLVSTGATNAEEGLVLGYELADRYRDDGLINRVILCSDGVANVGRTGPESVLERIKHWADNGVELTTVGFGMGNYNDVLMEQLADAGDGRYAYVDDLDEARRLFVEELTGTLFTIGSEAKAQVEFNPDVVSRYRLLGYENRDIADEDFRDPTVDAGEIGAGHTATAVYEVKLHKHADKRAGRELATLRVRYRPHGSDIPVEIEHRMVVGDLERRWDRASASLRLATLVTEYAEILKGSYWAKTGDMGDVLSRARSLAREIDDDRVADWVELVDIARELLAEEGRSPRGITD